MLCVAHEINLHFNTGTLQSLTWKHRRYAKIRGIGESLTIDWGGREEQSWKSYFSHLKNIRFAFSQINLSYLGRSPLNYKPTSIAARKEN